LCGTVHALYPERGREIRSFTLTMASDMGLKRDRGRGSFVDSVTSTTESFYGEVLQRVRAWKAGPPKLKRPIDKGETAEEAVAELIGVEPDQIGDLPEAIEGARTESPKAVEPATVDLEE
jgi:hypothetical protein